MTKENEVQERGLITQDDSIFQSANKKMFCTMNLEEKGSQVKLYNSLQECDVRLNDIKGTVVTVTDIFVEKKEVPERDEKTDEVILDSETGCSSPDSRGGHRGGRRRWRRRPAPSRQRRSEPPRHRGEPG